MSDKNRKLKVLLVSPYSEKQVGGIINWTKYIVNYHRENDGEVAHICTSGSFGLIRDLLIVKAAQKKGVKTVAHTHFGRIPQILNSSGWETFLLKQLVKRVDCVAVMDIFTLKALREAL